jgi:hypothetical protein
MKDSDRQLLVELRRTLLHLHKTLLDWERKAYERVHGRKSANELLQIIVTDPQFAWLRPASALIVSIDESLEIDALEGPEIDVDLILAQARAFVLPEAGSPHAERYRAALQEHPDAVLAHGAVSSLLKAARPAAGGADGRPGLA